jgi:F-type H+-transporting ATPase subunit epsilon
MADSPLTTGDLKLIVVTPESTALDVAAEFVALPLYDGEIGIGRGHAPMIGRLGFGELRYKVGTQTWTYYVDGGFVQVQDNVVSVLTNRAIPPQNLNAAAADDQLQEALARKTSNPEEMAIRERLVLQARAQKRIAVKQ